MAGSEWEADSVGAQPSGAAALFPDAVGAADILAALPLQDVSEREIRAMPRSELMAFVRTAERAVVAIDQLRSEALAVLVRHRKAQQPPGDAR
jgi:hypothetical protein